MGSGEQSSPAKHSKPTSTQETTPPPAYPDWSQACYGSGFAPPYPYMWGGQHPMMPPYGTPIPYPTMYPPPGVYGHPGMPMTPIQPNPETETKASNGKDRAPNKKSKGNSGNVNGGGGVRAGDNGKAASSSGNDGATQSAESGNDVSSDGTDDDDRQEYSGGKKGSFHQMLADANARKTNSGPNIPLPGNPVGSMPATGVNIGMDLWNPSMKMQPNHSGVPQTTAPPPMMADQWVQQDERELKRQKRKQSNRESARRSRQRKQAECEELQARVEALSSENHSLRDELKRISEECGNLTSENNSIKDELTRVYGPEAVSKLDS